jgi:hypothetical protein
MRLLAALLLFNAVATTTTKGQNCDEVHGDEASKPDVGGQYLDGVAKAPAARNQYSRGARPPCPAGEYQTQRKRTRPFERLEDWR